MPTYILGSILRTLRQRALFTQEKLAERSGVSVGTIAGLESGRTRRPRTGSVRLLAEALDLTTEQRAALFAAARGDPVAPGVNGAQTIDPFRATRTQRVVPAQLPADLAAFAGRSDDLKRLDDMLPAHAARCADTVVIAAITGIAGVGKTTLAVRWAHRVTDWFPDGQLYVNLRGFGPTEPPVRPTEAVRGFLAALQVPPQDIPTNLPAQVGLYRSLLAGRRVLVVLDNARDADQVRPMVPGSPGCLVVVTSRDQLVSLIAAEGAQPLIVDPLPAADAMQLLALRLGEGRVAAEPQAVGDIIVRCAGLPLALASVAARVATRPGFSLDALAGQLRDTCGSLDMFRGEDAAVDMRTVFSWSYRAVSSDAAHLFRLLGMHPGRDFAAPAAASLVGAPEGGTTPLLAELTRAHLLTEHTPGRYTIHALLRTYAAELFKLEDSEVDGRDATLRSGSRSAAEHADHDAEHTVAGDEPKPT